MVASVGRENVLTLTITVGMCVFLCSNKNEISFNFLLRAHLPCYTSNNKIYDNDSNILIDMVYAFNMLTGLLIIVFII